MAMLWPFVKGPEACHLFAEEAYGLCVEWLGQSQELGQAGMQEWMRALASYFDMLGTSLFWPCNCFCICNLAAVACCFSTRCYARHKAHALLGQRDDSQAYLVCDLHTVHCTDVLLLLP